ncbi:MAG: TonB-dependent receptor plug domain-containing protein [Pseudomonadota bacterium]
MRVNIIFVITIFTWAASLCSSYAIGQTEVTSNTNKQTYKSDYFERFNPQTARDLIDRLPGFTLQLGNARRGFGETAGNVLVNGARPSSKAGGVEEALGRIPANRVQQIDVIRGGAGTSEAAGQSVVANIILSASPSSGRWEGRLQHPADGRINAFVDFTLVRPLRTWQTSTQIEGSIDRRPLDGTRVSRDENGHLTVFQREKRPSASNTLTVSSEAQRPAFSGELRLTSRLSRRFGTVDTERQAFLARRPDETVDELFQLNLDQRLWNAEFGFDWTRGVENDWSIKILSLSSYNDRTDDQMTTTESPLNTFSSGSVFERQQRSFESVFRSTMARRGEHRLRPEIGAEVTYNRLDSSLSSQTEDSSGVITNVAIPAADVLVEELRSEVFAHLICTATKRLTMETGIAGELSAISVSGDAENKQTLAFAKPFAAIIYNMQPGVQMRIDGRRRVGQLSFADFAASASAADDRLLAGNPALGPDQTTRGSVSLDLRGGTGRALNIEFFHEWQDDILEQSLLPPDGSGLANAGSARLWGVTVDTSLPLTPLIPGGLMEVEADIRDSSFDDPITGDRRQISNTDSPSILVEFRQDLNQRRMAWGVSYRAALSGTFFFTDEESFNRDGERWSAFAETTRFFGAKTTLELSGIGSQNFLRERRFFDPDRGGVFAGSERIETNRGMFVNLTVSGQF